jgi:molecular chaperone DnaK
MRRETIDFGIDLGTTNSSIAMWGSDGQIEVFKNLEQSHSTPSAVYESKNSKIYVGDRAKQATKTDFKNVHMEFKQEMGRPTTYTFPRSGRTMKPEDLSAEVLKSLKADIQRRIGEDLQASVITIPAAFDRSEIAATNRAASLAGFTASPLCLEPVAAALAYAHRYPNHDGFWMVFDFGGGTFDAAVVQLKDEEFQVVNHEGDNHLGGKLIDWAILDEILIPAFQKEFSMPDFSRTSKDVKVETAIARLKYAAEAAKVRLSVEEKTDIQEEDLLVVPSGESASFLFELRRADVNRIAERYILRAIALCRKALQEKRLSPQHIDRLILVGGPTQMPIFREMLADPKYGLGMPLEYGVDPMTVVAQGAAIFARTQKLKSGLKAQPAAGSLHLELEFDAVGADAEFTVAGCIKLDDGKPASGYTIQFIKPDWKSGQIRVSADGKFMTQLLAERGENVYAIEIQDTIGNMRRPSPEQLKFLRKPMFKEIPLTNTISVELADQTIDVLFEKNIALPLKKTRKYKQTSLVRKGDPSGAIRIPLLEGANPRANRNVLIGCLEITPDRLRGDVPSDTYIEFTLSVDLSNNLTAMAYIDHLDQEFQESIDLEKAKTESRHRYIEAEAKEEIGRAKSLQEKVADVSDEKVKAAWARIEQEKLVEEVERAHGLLERGGDATDILLDCIRRLRLALDGVEEVLEWPALVAEAAKNKADAAELVASKHAGDDDKTLFARLTREHEHALAVEDPDLLRRASMEFDDLCYTVLHKNPGYWVSVFEHQQTLKAKMTDQELARELFAQGRRSIDTGDVDGLKSAVRQLWKLVPQNEVRAVSRGRSTVRIA